MAAMTQIQKKKRAEAEALAKRGGVAFAEPPAKAPEALKPEKEERPRSNNPIVRALQCLLDLLNSMAFQTLIYVFFVGIFQLIVLQIRAKEEFFLDKHVMDRIVENHFDSSHNTFQSIRRVADVYEWGNTVLWPGLLGDLDTQTWPDGDESFHLDGATPYTVAELVERMDQMDWTDGLTIRVGRVSSQACTGRGQLGVCLPELDVGLEETAAYGYNGSSYVREHGAFVYHSSEALGANPEGVASAHFASLRNYDASGYVAVVIPFFSDTYLPEERGLAADVTDFRLHRKTADPDDTAAYARTPRYHCVRLSHNGVHVRQLCDPNDPATGRTTGVVRAAIRDMWNEGLKKGHFVDHRARVMTITLQLRNNNVGVAYRISLMLEFTALGAVFTSFNTETRVLDSDAVEYMGTYANIAFGLVIFFCVMEGIEILSNGIGSYITDVWNVMDWLNYIIYIIVWWRIQECYAALDAQNTCAAGSLLCSEVGYFDDWRVMEAFQLTKIFLSLCVCIQLLKIMKFLELLVPKTGLSVRVLKECIADLAFFSITFLISMAAFSMMLHIQLGPVMEGYSDQIPAIVSLSRALFGDFDIDEIMDNSSNYLNTLLFLGYLGFAVFIMLSMFLAILAEAQARVRDTEGEQKAEKKCGSGEWPDEYGCVSASTRAIDCRRGGGGGDEEGDAGDAGDEGNAGPVPPAMDRSSGGGGNDADDPDEVLRLTCGAGAVKYRQLHAGDIVKSDGAGGDAPTGGGATLEMLLREVRALREQQSNDTRWAHTRIVTLENNLMRSHGLERREPSVLVRRPAVQRALRTCAQLHQALSVWRTVAHATDVRDRAVEAARRLVMRRLFIGWNAWLTATVDRLLLRTLFQRARLQKEFRAIATWRAAAARRRPGPPGG